MLNIESSTIIAAAAKISKPLNANETNNLLKQQQQRISTTTSPTTTTKSPTSSLSFQSSTTSSKPCVNTYKKLNWIQHCLWIYLIFGFCSPKCKLEIFNFFFFFSRKAKNINLLFILILHAQTVCFAGYNEKRLLHDLLDTYNTLERPVVNESDPLQISFGLTLMQIIDVDEKNQMLVTNIWLKLVSSNVISISTPTKTNCRFLFE